MFLTQMFCYWGRSWNYIFSGGGRQPNTDDFEGHWREILRITEHEIFFFLFFLEDICRITSQVKMGNEQKCTMHKMQITLTSRSLVSTNNISSGSLYLLMCVMMMMKKRHQVCYLSISIQMSS